MWYLENMFDMNNRIICDSHYDALVRFNQQETNDEGFIPWKIMYQFKGE